MHLYLPHLFGACTLFIKLDNMWKELLDQELIDGVSSLGIYTQNHQR